MNRMVAAIVSAMVNDPQFSKAIKEKIGTSVDTEDMEKQLDVLQVQLSQTLGIKTRLKRQMDTLDINDPHFDRKMLDLQCRYDEQYGRMEEIETQIDEVKSRIQNIRQEKISGDNIYQLLLAFDKVYASATEVEQKEFMRAFIERIDLYPEKQKDGNWIKNIFQLPASCNLKEEKEGRLDYVLSRSVSKTTYFICYTAIAFVSSLFMQLAVSFGLYGSAGMVLEEKIELSFFVKSTLAYLPAIWVMIGLAVFLIGALPKLTSVVWGYLGLSFFITFIGRMLKLPEWVKALTPFSFVPKLPVDEIEPLPLLCITGIAVVLTVLGFVFYAKRDKEG